MATKKAKANPGVLTQKPTSSVKKPTSYTSKPTGKSKITTNGRSR